MPALCAVDLTAGDIVAVRQQDRIPDLFCGNRGSELRHHIGPVQIIGDAAKSLGLTLGTEHLLRLVQTL